MIQHEIIKKSNHVYLTSYWSFKFVSFFFFYAEGWRFCRHYVSEILQIDPLWFDDGFIKPEAIRNFRMKLLIKSLQNDANKFCINLPLSEKMISFTVCVSFFVGYNIKKFFSS